MPVLNASHRRAPGIRFEVQAGPPTPTIPRMDIAAFVGFAAAGPIGIPVRVEDVAQFRAVFGEDLRLAWDTDDGDWSYAHLGPAIRDFFRNGGKRCWVLRVANEQAAANRFVLPGVKFIAEDGTLEGAVAVARSEGSWSDNLRIGTALLVQPLAIDAGLPGVSIGDLVRISLDDGSGSYFGFVLQIRGLNVEFSPSYFVSTGAAKATRVNIPNVLPPSSAALLTFELRARAGDQLVFRAEELGFGPKHANYWGDLPTDVKRFDGQATLPSQETLFPLAGGTDRYSIPIGMNELIEYTGGPDLRTEDQLERDGMVPFAASLFTDPKLADVGVLDLLNEADFLRYRMAVPRRLGGMHALLALEEPALIAIPDAVQDGWNRRAVPPIPAPAAVVPQPKPAHDRFLRCGIRELLAPVLSGSVDSASGTITLSWIVTDGNRFTLEESTRPDFENAAQILDGSDIATTIYGRSPGNYFYRVSATEGVNRSDWSAGLGLRVGTPTGYELSRNRDERILPEVQSTLLRMCAAKGDWFAVLSPAYGARWEDAAKHVATLQASSEGPSLGYGALYHSWLVSRDELRKGGLRTTPPDGAVAGMMASRSVVRGPWIAPANEAFSGVVTTDPLLRKGDRPDWFDIPVNWIFLEPRGFLTMSADTLSLDDDLVPINVRRLLGLLRRMALDRGQPLVFEPNDDSLRRLVISEFSEMLGELFRRGAFAGRTPSKSFQVVVSDGNNPRQSVEAGRFIVELRVAPALPLKFLTVRLVQTDDRRLLLEGA